MSRRCKVPSCHLRPPREQDRHWLSEWANDAQVRAAAFSCEPVSWSTHVAWFAEKRGQDGCRTFIAEDASGTPVGQVHFDRRSDGDYEIAVSLSSDSRGQALATPLIEQAVQKRWATCDSAAARGKRQAARFDVRCL